MSVAYKLRRPDHAKIHDVFHLSLLKEHKGAPPTIPPEWPDNLGGETVDLTPHHVLGVRTIKHGGQIIPQLLIQWKGEAPEDATWEFQEAFMHTLSNFNLEDEVNFDDRGCYDAEEVEGRRHSSKA